MKGPPATIYSMNRYSANFLHMVKDFSIMVLGGCLGWEKNSEKLIFDINFKEMILFFVSVCPYFIIFFK